MEGATDDPASTRVHLADRVGRRADARLHARPRGCVMSSRASASAELIRPAPDGEVEIGERITVLDLTTSAVRDYRLVDTAAAPDPAEGEISIASPLGSALLGRHVGDVV